MPVPLCDIQAQYRALKSEIDDAVERVLSSGQAILGPEVSAFEQEAASFCGAAFGVGCGSGTDALVLALHALGIGPGDEVLVPPFTFFATVEKFRFAEWGPLRSSSISTRLHSTSTHS